MLFEKVKIEIIIWCIEKNVNVLDIFCLCCYLKRRFFIFVICVKIDFDDYEKMKELNFWLKNIIVRDWNVCIERNIKLE